VCGICYVYYYAGAHSYAGLRTFAKQSTFDNIIVILLGAVLARGVVGASPFWSTVGASVVMGSYASGYGMDICKKSKI
jgi:hypothetical protein